MKIKLELEFDDFAEAQDFMDRNAAGAVKTTGGKKNTKKDADDADGDEDEKKSTKSTGGKKPPTKDAVDEGEAEELTVATLRAKALPISKAGGKPKIKAWLAKNGADEIAELDEKHFKKFHTYLETLEDGPL